jgi:hypothetical protein
MLNPGSVYWLTALREFGPEITKTQRYETWWENMLNQWAALLDVIIWLEAPDRVLLERVHARDDWHEAKEQPRHEALETFACYHTCYERMVSAMTADGGPRVLHFRTDQLSADHIVESVLVALELEDEQAAFTRGARRGLVQTGA